MLSQTEMSVVFVLCETISKGLMASETAKVYTMLE